MHVVIFDVLVRRGVITNFTNQFAIAEVTTSYSCIVGFSWSPFASRSALSVCLDHSLCVQNFCLFSDSLELSSSEAFREICEA